jgi:hypothetical protein
MATSPRRGAYAESLCGEPQANLRENLVVHRTNRPRATKNENAELAKAGSAFFVGGCGVSGGLTGA